MRIFLIGFMGYGKSTNGKKLATKLGYDFIDLDHQVEKVAGTSIAAYFSANGETAFRQLESDTLKTMDYPLNSVIATGGGTPCYFDNMEWMNANGTTIYIEMTALALAKRLESGKEKRPLIRDYDEQQLVTFIEGKLEERELFYIQAAITVQGINLTPDDLRAAILMNK